MPGADCREKRSFATVPKAGNVQSARFAMAEKPKAERVHRGKGREITLMRKTARI
jgi:hypothetical protein